MQQHVRERVMPEIESYLDADTTAIAPDVMRNPVAEYIEPRRLAQERDPIRTTPIIVGQGLALRRAASVPHRGRGRCAGARGAPGRRLDQGLLNVVSTTNAVHNQRGDEVLECSPVRWIRGRDA